MHFFPLSQYLESPEIINIIDFFWNSYTYTSLSPFTHKNSLFRENLYGNQTILNKIENTELWKKIPLSDKNRQQYINVHGTRNFHVYSLFMLTWFKLTWLVHFLELIRWGATPSRGRREGKKKGEKLREISLQGWTY